MEEQKEAFTMSGTRLSHGLSTLQEKMQLTALLVDIFLYQMPLKVCSRPRRVTETGRRRALKTVALAHMPNLRTTKMQCVHGQRTKKRQDRNTSLVAIMDEKNKKQLTENQNFVKA